MAAPRASKPPGFNTKSPTIKRILQESRELACSPDPTITAAPLESNLFEWHFTITGPPSTPYADGIYHGRIVLPPTYPLRPPSFRFLTPSGRFEVNREICLSISGHHEETWQPAWGIRTALCAIRAFMSGDAKGQLGGLDMGAAARESMAKESRAWRCAGCGAGSNEQIMKEVEQRWKENHEDGERPEAEEVPEELRLAFREDLDKSGKDEAGKAADVKEDEKPSPSTVPVQPSSPGQPAVRATASSVSPIPTPTRTTPSAREDSVGSRSRPQAETVAVPRQRVTLTTTTARNAGPPQQEAPAWIDKAIACVVAILAIMVLRRFAGSDEY